MRRKGRKRRKRRARRRMPVRRPKSILKRRPDAPKALASDSASDHV
ncbi:MAG: hypothetical protein OJF58_003565 [Enhydrobacter sp.]|nr:MAG: hypothetical protein OJF58_003565 [Enhydrobacter sp.]